ncbi:MAG: DUF2244 domain-containing protein [Burkholderiales bacterium]|nr:MAG: DUF2244 domain-containing protein [Burkholderiales bacterium]
MGQRRDGAWHWSLRRRCAVSPSQLASVFAMLGTASLLVAGFFWMQGAVLVMPFAVLELLALAAAFVVHARHATDGESVVLEGGRLVIESESAGVVRRCEFDRDRVRLNTSGRQVLVEVRAGAQAVQIGRHLRSDLRPVLLSEMRRALREG